MGHRCSIMRKNIEKFAIILIFFVLLPLSAWLGENGYVSVWLIFAGWLLIMGIPIMIGNDMILYRSLVKKESTPSPAPLIGGGMASAGLLCLLRYFGAECWWWALIPLLLDYACLPMLVDFLWQLSDWGLYAVPGRDAGGQEKNSAEAGSAGSGTADTNSKEKK